MAYRRLYLVQYLWHISLYVFWVIAYEGPFSAYKVLKIDEKQMISKRYNKIAHPFPDTIREKNTNNQGGIK